MNIMLCVNDPDSGHFTGQLDSVYIDTGRGHLLLECDSMAIEHVTLDGRDCLRICDEVFPLLDYVSFVGSWCWDMASLSREDVSRLLTLCRQHHATCLEALLEFSTAWEQGQSLLPLLPLE